MGRYGPFGHLARILKWAMASRPWSFADVSQGGCDEGPGDCAMPYPPLARHPSSRSKRLRAVPEMPSGEAPDEEGLQLLSARLKKKCRQPAKQGAAKRGDSQRFPRVGGGTMITVECLSRPVLGPHENNPDPIVSLRKNCNRAVLPYLTVLPPRRCPWRPSKSTLS